MIKKIVFCFLLFGTGRAYAQVPANMQKQMEQAQKMLKQMQSNPQVQAAMKKAHHIMDSLKTDTGYQNQMASTRHLLDSMKKTNPAMANINIPDMSNVQMPNFDSLSASLNKASTTLQNMSNAIDQTVPKKNPFHHAAQIPRLTKNDLIGLADIILAKVKPVIHTNLIMESNLNQMAKDTSINLAATGAFILASGGNTEAAAFLICKGILRNPGDAWAVNDFGVFFREFQQNDKALQCYYYANSLLTKQSEVIYTNIGWAAGYYGDFDEAIKNFDKALAIDGDYSEALEGEALIAYAEGDIQKLWACLSKEVKKIKYKSAGETDFDDGPSDDFATLSATQAAMNEGNTDNQTTDPNNDHTFDNSDADEGGTQNPPPGADVDQVSFPELKKVFIGDPRQIEDALVQYIQWEKKEGDVFKQKINAIHAEEATLKPLVQPPTIINGVAIVYPVSFRKYVELFFDEVNVSLEKREGWYASKFYKKLDALRKDVVSHDMDMNNQYNKALLNCLKLNGAAGDACTREVNCKWIPQMYKSKNSDLEAIAQLWDDYYNHLVDVLNWYIDASAPLVSRVHDEGWNRDMNDWRKFNVWGDLFTAYARWGEALGEINSPIVPIIRQTAPACASTEVAGVKPPDPYSNPPKHIKEYEGPCFDITSNAWGTGLSVEQTCHATTISFGVGPFSAFYTHVDDPIAAQNKGYTNEIGTKVSVSKDVDIIKLEGEDENGKKVEQSVLSGSAGIEGSVDLKFDDLWNFTSGSSSIGASAEIGGISVGGISATRTVEMVAGQLQVNPLSVSTSSDIVK